MSRRVIKRPRVVADIRPTREKSEESIRVSEVLPDPSTAPGKVTDEELLQLLALVQITSGVVFCFICALGLTARRLEKRASFHDKIPTEQIVLYKFAESIISVTSGILVKFGSKMGEYCCDSTKPTPFFRVIAIIIDILLLVLASIALFWPSKSYMSPVTLATIYILEVIFYSSLIIFLSRLMVPGATKKEEDIGPSTQSSA